MTVGEYKIFVQSDEPADAKGNHRAIVPCSDKTRSGNPISYITTGGGVDFNPNWSKEDNPIIDVSWDDALAYAAQWAHADLPTEAQWEKAARGTGWRWKYPWGDKFDATKLWCSKNTFFDSGGTHNVGELGVSPYGCTDMAGNASRNGAKIGMTQTSGKVRTQDSTRKIRTVGEKQCHVMRGGILGTTIIQTSVPFPPTAFKSEEEQNDVGGSGVLFEPTLLATRLMRQKPFGTEAKSAPTDSSVRRDPVTSGCCPTVLARVANRST